MTVVAPEQCNRLHGGSIRDCVCRLPNDGWLECPPAPAPVFMGGHMPRPPVSTPGYANVPAQALTGDICADCGGPNMVRTGTCMTCQDCGSTSGGCS